MTFSRAFENPNGLGWKKNFQKKKFFWNPKNFLIKKIEIFFIFLFFLLIANLAKFGFFLNFSFFIFIIYFNYFFYFFFMFYFLFTGNKHESILFEFASKCTWNYCYNINSGIFFWFLRILLLCVFTMWETSTRKTQKVGPKLSKPRNEMKIFMFEVVLCIVRLCVVMCLHYVKN